MEIKEYELIVSEGKKPLWKLIVASLLFTISIGLIINLVYSIWSIGFDRLPIKFITSNIKSLGLTISLGVTLSITKTILIDTDKNKLVSRYFVGPFYKDVLSVIPELKYVSIFLDTSDAFQVNLWYDRNKHYEMYIFEKENNAFEFAELVAGKLNIDLLDATEKGNFKWVEITKNNKIQ